ncbi:50S ribosomal protein L24 [Methanococcoides sp. SA1]|nr:50S ribosomal protein L24 [Methanococcoides sp. SA1]
MKSEFSKSWNRSVQPRKQRKFRANAPNHIKRKFMGCNLDKELRVKYGVRSIGVRKGDTVKIMRGKFSGKQGKVGIVDIKKTRLQIEGVQRPGKAGGEKLITWFHPSSVKIIILDVSDSKRLKGNKEEKKPQITQTDTDKKTKKTVKKAAKEDKK